MTEQDVITAAREPEPTPLELEYKRQLDLVFRYLEKRNGWIRAGDTDGLVEFRHLERAVDSLAQSWKASRGSRR